MRNQSVRSADVHFDAEVVNYAENDIIVINTDSSSARELLPEARLDEMTRSNGGLFRRRFGIDAGASARRKVLELRRLGDFTDAEIRRLNLTGRLSIRWDLVKCDPVLWMLMVGVVQLLALSPIFASAVFAFFQIPADQPLKLLGVLAVLVASTGAAYSVYWVYVAPYFIVRKRIGSFRR